MTRIIERNTTTPTLKSQMFTTTFDFQTSIDIYLLQGENANAAENKTVGYYQIIGISPAKQGIPQIEVTFDIDPHGFLNVHAKDKTTGKKQAVRNQWLQQPG
jgi:molecular chaperone DnaK